jgi:hypothetical protein
VVGVGHHGIFGLSVGQGYRFTGGVEQIDCRRAVQPEVILAQTKFFGQRFRNLDMNDKFAAIFRPGNMFQIAQNDELVFFAETEVLVQQMKSKETAARGSHQQVVSIQVTRRNHILAA